MRASRTHIKCFVALLLGVAGVTGCLAPKSLSVLLGPASHIQFSTPSRLLHSDTTPDQAPREQLSQTYGKLPLSFEANRGQTDAQVRFLSRSHRQTLFLTSTEAVLVFTKPSPTATDQPETRGQAAGTMLRMAFAGSNPQVRVTGLEELPGKANYIIGNDPTKWRTNVPTYGKVHYQDLYPGIDLIYYSTQRQLEYDLVVGPGADPHKIVLAFQGADHLAIDTHGDLVVHTPDGAILQRRPVAYQEIDGVRLDITCIYVLKETGQVSLQVAAYDATSPLVIDPALSYSTYLGGSDNDFAGSIAVDSAGNAYVTGFTTSTNFPTTPGAFQPTFGGSSDVFVTKLNPTGSALVYSTYLGGTGDDDSGGIAVDSAGNAYVAGVTSSANFPTTPGAFQLTLGGSTDAFVTKLNPTGSALAYSTYLGGTGDETCDAIAVDSAGNAYVTGQTGSTDFPTTSGAFQPTLSGSNDAFIARISPADIVATDSATAQEGQIVTASTAPTMAGEAGVSVTLTNTPDGGGPATVTVRTYSANPTAVNIFDAGGGFVDVHIKGADPTDLATARFYYPSTVPEATEAGLQLLYFTGTAWALVLSSVGLPPVNDTTDNQDGTVSSGRFLVTFDSTSTPKITQLTGTVFTMTTPGGTPVAWGNNQVGQLGNGTFTTSNTPTHVSTLTHVSAISGGAGHSVAVKADSTAWAWGSNFRGQLGNGTTTTSNVPVAVSGLSQVRAVSAGGAHSLAVKTDGTVWSWGDNTTGQLGLGTTGGTQLVPVHLTTLTGITAVSAGAGHSVALKNDGSVWAWGDNRVGELGNGTVGGVNPTPAHVPGLTGVTAIATFGAHTLALKTDGTVWAWGDNQSGQLGVGTIGGNSPTPVQVSGLTGIIAITAGAAHSVALGTDGLIRACGNNSSGQLGDGTFTTRSTPTLVQGLIQVTHIGAGGAHSLALKADGTAWAWGDNRTGQLGTGNFTTSRRPVQVTGISGGLLIAGGGAYSLAIVTP